MKALIVDDERLARNELKRLLKAHDHIEIIGEASHGEEALERIAALDPELLFLDVQMPGKNGFDVLADLERPPKVIFCTAYDHFAIRAFEVNALDYLVKPIEPERLAQALARLEQEEPDDTPVEQLGEADRVFVKDGERCWFVQLGEVSVFESEGNYTRLYFGHEKPLVYRSLSYLEERLDESAFFRASRKHMINLKAIAGLTPGPSGGMMIEMNSGMTVEMSRRQAQKFKEQMSL